MGRSKHRHEDTMLTIDSESAVVDYDDILEAITVDYDDSGMGYPWDECDGFEHSTERTDHEGNDTFYDRGRLKRIVPQWDSGVYEHARANGQSKQVSAEREARNRRSSIEYLLAWYNGNSQWYCVRGEFRGYFASLGGIDTEDYARTDCVREVAAEIVAQLESDGYTVEGKPQRGRSIKYANWTREDWRKHYKRNWQETYA